MCCLQETKLELVQPAIWREIGGSSLDQFAFVPAKGSAGGIVLGWNSALLIGTVGQVGEFCLSVDFVVWRDNFIWRCTTVYGPTERSRKRDFWEELSGSRGVASVP